MPQYFCWGFAILDTCPPPPPPTSWWFGMAQPALKDGGGSGKGWSCRARIFKLLRSPRIDSKESILPAYVARAGIFKQSMGVRNWVGIGLSYRPARKSTQAGGIYSLESIPESVATLPPFSPIEGQKWFDQISSQWESQKNRFALIYFGKIQFLPPCIWNLPFMSTASGLHKCLKIRVGPVRQPYSYSAPSPHRLFKNSNTENIWLGELFVQTLNSVHLLITSPVGWHRHTLCIYLLHKEQKD